MTRPLLLAALVVLALVAAFFWTRESTHSDRAADFGRAAAQIPGADASELAAPDSVDATATRTDASEAASKPAPTPTVAVSTWTGVRVRITALEDGRPLANVRLRARGPDAKQAWTEVDASRGTIGNEPRTGDDGLVELELAPGVKYALLARSITVAAGPGNVDVDPPLAPNEVRELALVLPTEADLVFHGRVIDRETKAPIPGARVGPARGQDAIQAGAEQRTDSDGRFHVVVATWRSSSLNVFATGYEFATCSAVRGHSAPENAFEIALSAVAAVRITVVDATGAPMPDVRATLSIPRYLLDRTDFASSIGSGWVSINQGDSTYVALTGEDGVALVADVPPRFPMNGVLHRGSDEIYRSPEPIVLAPGETRSLTWRVGGGCTIHGIARETDGRPAVGLPIALESTRTAYLPYFESTTRGARSNAVTDDEGHFEFADVQPGRWRVGPAPKERQRVNTVEPEDPAACAPIVVVPPGAPRVDVEIRVHRGLAIRGRVLDPTGAPVGSASVVCTQESQLASMRDSVRNADGRFVLGPLESGEYELYAQAHGQFVGSEAVTARAGDSEVVLRLRAGGAIDGLVVDASTGAPMAAVVTLRRRVSAEKGYTQTSANEQGVFRLGGLEDGTYDVTAMTPEGGVGVAQAIEIVAGPPRDVRVVLEPGARVRVRYDGPEPTCGIFVLVGETQVVEEGLEKGSDGVFAVPAGAVVVRVWSYVDEKEFDLPLTLNAGETRDLVFDGAWR